MKEKITNIFSRINTLMAKRTSTVVVKEKKHRFAWLEKHNWIVTLFLVLFLSVILAASLRGMPGNPTIAQFNTISWKDQGPLELSPERGRFALLYSIAEQHSFTFSPEVARFAAPDVGYKDGVYGSLFAPTVSFLMIPGYLLGKSVGLAQVGTYAMVALFALLNVFLIRAVAVRLGANPLAGFIAGMTFLFASPAFAYAVTLYQHHVSTFIILLSIYLLIRFTSWWSLLSIWTLFALSFTVDYPNFFLMLPIALGAFGKSFMVEKHEGSTAVTVSFPKLFAMIGIILPFLFFFWFNATAYGNPFQLSGTLDRAIEVKSDGKPLLESEIMLQRLKDRKQEVVFVEKSFLAFFQNRNLMNGTYSHLLSPDRGIISFTPVILFGFLGIFFLYRQKNPYFTLLAAVLGFNLLLYSMWADPYGGWAFGSRYMIPAYAIMSIFIAIILTKWGKHILFILFFLLVLGYSVSVNTMGAITSNRNPPQVEALGLEKETGVVQEYTYIRNYRMLQHNITKSYVYHAYVGNHVSAMTYYAVLVGSIMAVFAFSLIYLRFILANKEEFVTYVDRSTRRRRKRSPIKQSIARPISTALTERKDK